MSKFNELLEGYITVLSEKTQDNYSTFNKAENFINSEYERIQQQADQLAALKKTLAKQAPGKPLSDKEKARIMIDGTKLSSSTALQLKLMLKSIK